MMKMLLTAAAVLTMMAGVANAQSSSTTTTTETTVPVAPPTVVQTTREHSVDSNGAIIDHSRTVTTGTAVSPYGETTTTRRTIETTTDR
jgi:hypothetical protein